jgi:hypothetical protein
MPHRSAAEKFQAILTADCVVYLTVGKDRNGNPHELEAKLRTVINETIQEHYAHVLIPPTEPVQFDPPPGQEWTHTEEPDELKVVFLPASERTL